MTKYLALVLIVLVAVVVVQNTEVVTYRFLFWEVQMSRIVLLPLAVSVGGIIGYLLGRRRQGKAKT